MVKWGLIFSFVLVVLAMFLSSGVFTYYPGDVHWESNRAGFFTGFLHGIITPAMLIISILSSFKMYEASNIGWFYDFGFLFGVLVAWGGGKTTKNIVKNYYQSSGKNIDEESLASRLKEKLAPEKKKEQKQKKSKV